MRRGDLTTLASVKGWLGVTGPGSDDMLARLISGRSAAILAYLERPWILPQQYIADAYDGEDNRVQFLRNWPVTSVQEVTVGGQIIPYAPVIVPTISSIPTFGGPDYGYRFETWDGIPPGGPQSVELLGERRFWRGRLNVQITYKAGYLVENEPATVPLSGDNFTITTLQPQGIWAQDVGVTYSDGTPLTPVRLPAVPSLAGQYQALDPDQDLGTYLFSPSDAGRRVLISYGYIPYALEQVSVEMIAERFVYRGRIGEISRTVASQVTARYDTSDIPKYAIPILQRFKSVLPL